MYCKQCGNQILEESNFCEKCGAKVEKTEENVTEVKREQAVETIVLVQGHTNKEEKNFILSIIKPLKGFFSPKTVQTVQASAKSGGLEWIVFMVFSALVCAFAVAANAKVIIKELIETLTSGITDAASGLLSNNLMGSMVGTMANPIMSSVGNTITDALFNFAAWFIGGLFIGAGTYFVVSSLIFCGMKLFMGVKCKFPCVFNMVAIATFPTTLALMLNIILGYVWLPLVIVSFMVGLMASAVLLYIGMQKLEKIEKSPYWTYVLTMAVVILAVVILAVIVVAIGLAGMVSQLSGLASGLGNLF